MPSPTRTLFITCSDSDLVIGEDEGSSCVCQNPANVVPSYREENDVSATIEYFVSRGGIQRIVVCGHTDCAILASILPRDTRPTLSAWFRYIEPAAQFVQDNYPHADQSTALKAFATENVRNQLANLRMHPAVANAIASEQLSVHGWVYDQGSREKLVL